MQRTHVPRIRLVRCTHATKLERPHGNQSLTLERLYTNLLGFIRLKRAPRSDANTKEKYASSSLFDARRETVRVFGLNREEEAYSWSGFPSPFGPTTWSAHA